MMQKERTAKQWSQTMREVKLKVAMVFARQRQLCCLWEDMTSEEAICLYTLAYINTKELVFRREEIMLWPDHNWLVCFREYAREAYTWT